MKNRQKNAINFIVNNMIMVEKFTDVLGVPKNMSFKKRSKITEKLLKHIIKNTTVGRGGKIEKQKRDISDEMYPSNGETFNSAEDIADFLFNK